MNLLRKSQSRTLPPASTTLRESAFRFDSGPGISSSDIYGGSSNLLSNSESAVKTFMEKSSVSSSSSSSDTSPFGKTEEIEQLRIFAHYLKIMKCVTDVNRVPEELLTRPFGTQRRRGADETGTTTSSSGVLRGSNLQDRVIEGIQEAIATANVEGELQVISVLQLLHTFSFNENVFDLI